MRPWARPHDRTQPQPPSLADQFDLTLTLTASPPRCWPGAARGAAAGPWSSLARPSVVVSAAARHGGACTCPPLRPQASRRVVDVRACSAGCLLLGRLLVSSFCRGDAHTAWFGRARAVGCPVPSRVPSSARSRAGQAACPPRSRADARQYVPIPLAFGFRQPGPAHHNKCFKKKMFLRAKRVLCLVVLH